MTDNELLLAMSELMDQKLKPVNIRLEAIEQSQQSMEIKLQNVEVRLQNVEVEQKRTALILENDILPRIQNLESCYTSTYKRYAAGIDRIDEMYTDISIIKKVVLGHSEKLQQFA